MSHFEKEEYIEIVGQILESEEFNKRKNYPHHGTITVYEHSLSVSKLSYLIAKNMKLDYKAAAIGGLLHDFYYEPWQGKPKSKNLFKKHGFVHAKEAANNAQIYFPGYMNRKVENIILRHMFPLNIIPPRYPESWIVSLADKIISCEVILHPSFFKYLVGFRK